MTRTVTTTAYSYTVCLVILWRYSFFFFFFFLLKMCEQPCAIPNCSGDKQDGLPGLHSAGVSLFALFWLLKKVVWSFIQHSSDISFTEEKMPHLHSSCVADSFLLISVFDLSRQNIPNKFNAHKQI